MLGKSVYDLCDWKKKILASISECFGSLNIGISISLQNPLLLKLHAK